MVNSDENTETKQTSDGEGEVKEKTLADYTEEELEEMDEDELAELKRKARLKAKLKRDAELEVLRHGLKDAKRRINRMLEIQKNMGKFPDVDGKNAISLCISALARHDDEKAIRNALNACLVYLKNQKLREEYEIEQAEKQREKEAEAVKSKKKGGFFSRK